MAKKVCYVVLKGRRPGIYNTWNECKEQTDKFPGADYHGCSSYEEAEEMLKSLDSLEKTYDKVKALEKPLDKSIDVLQEATLDTVKQISYPMYTRTVKDNKPTEWKIEESVF